MTVYQDLIGAAEVAIRGKFNFKCVHKKRRNVDNY